MKKTKEPQKWIKKQNNDYEDCALSEPLVAGIIELKRIQNCIENRTYLDSGPWKYRLLRSTEKKKWIDSVTKEEKHDNNTNVNGGTYWKAINPLADRPKQRLKTTLIKKKTKKAKKQVRSDRVYNKTDKSGYKNQTCN